MTLVYRIQDAEGRGPFKPGFSRHWSDDDFADGMIVLPTWMEEFGADLITRHRCEYLFCGSAVRTIDALNKWFSASEQRRLESLGYFIAALRVNRILAESEHQLVFAKSRLLTECVVVPWPHNASTAVA